LAELFPSRWHCTSVGAIVIFSENPLRLVVSNGCHLCEEAEPVVRRVARRYGFGVEIVDIDADDELVRLYALRVPVVLDPAGRVVAEGIIEERPLRKAVKRLRR